MILFQLLGWLGFASIVTGLALFFTGLFTKSVRKMIWGILLPVGYYLALYAFMWLLNPQPISN